jgi:hypothetical protein
MLKTNPTLNPLAFVLTARLAEHIADVRTIQAYKVLSWCNRAPDTATLIARLEEVKDQSLSIMISRTRGTEAAEEILSACEDLLYRAHRA